MSNLVELTKQDGIAVITITNPPVNALSPGVPEGISEALDQVAGDETVKVAVLIGGGRTFVAGADIKEFSKITAGAPRGPGRQPLFLKLEDSCKPIIAAIHGTAFGGGLELAMSAHYRVALSTAQVGQPEVKLGLIPGAGGTQRLPRLAGVAVALEMCVTGNPINAEDALKANIVDEIIDGDLLAGAIAFAQKVAGKPVPMTRARTQNLGANAELFAAAREAAAKKYRGLKAPQAAIDAIEAAAKMPFAEGCLEEQRLFMECLFSEQSKALIHVFFSEREVRKIPDISDGTPSIPVESAAVIGGGTMGAGIAMVLANAGIPVFLKETNQFALDRGLETIRSNYTRSLKRGRFTARAVEENLKRIQPILSYEQLANVDLVIEAVFESMTLKKEVFKELDRHCKSGAILASNTSSLSIDEIASSTARPGTVVGTHFFSPANVMRLLEIVRGKATSKEVIATCMRLAKTLGKVGVLVGNCRGFVGNRMFGPYRREAQFLVEEGAAIEAVDAALTDFGMVMGPLATADLAGLDVRWRIRQEHRHLEKPGIRQPFAEDKLCELGRYGQKTEAGWYKYDTQRRATTDPLVDQLLSEWVAEAGVPQRQISTEEIADRCILALVNEGARILQEGYALRASDIDIIYINGYGFPAYRGGPMWYADTLGLKTVYQRILQFHNLHGETWEPAPLLKQLAEQGRTFAEFGKPEAAAISS
ncbi:MAG: 3-hydroxyacyl-CoA dehydrogenase NAD-binding domain-containing protein [Candidatus Sulfotelmatobacter sp.]|jgi:3-hydroxyacyl-CoA dehydrogenase